MRDRPYQTEAITNILAEFGEQQSTLCVMPTGTGKTVVFAKVIQRMSEGRVMVLAHREELITQAAAKIAQITGQEPDIEMADQRADKGMWKARVVVSSIQTQIAGKPARMTRFNPSEFGLVIIDEAHHAPAASYRKVIEHYKQNHGCKLLGVTATPDRTDEKALGQIFGSAAFVYEIGDAIKSGWLVPVEQKSVTVNGLDYSNVKTIAGDLSAADIARAQQSEAVLHGIADPIIELANGRRGIVFATPGFAGDEGDEFHVAERLTEIFNRHKPGCAERVSQDTPRDQRKSMLKRFANGDIQFMVNVGVLTEGFDDPGIEVVAVARPTKSRALYCLDAETEILTNRGWRRHDDKMEAEELAAAFQPSDGTVEWSPVLASVRRSSNPDEQTFSVDTGQVNLKVTGNHRMVIRVRHGRSRQRSAWTFKTAEEASRCADAFEIPVCGSQEASGVPLTNDELKFIGMFMTDGNLNLANGQVTLYQSERYPEVIAYIQDLIDGCGFKFGRSVSDEPTNFGERNYPLHRWTISKGEPRGRDKHKTGWGRLFPYMEKDMSPLLENCTREQLLVLLESMNMGDGWKHKPEGWTRQTLSICTSRKVLADRIQSLCVRRNIRCNLGKGGIDGLMITLLVNSSKTTAQIGTNRKDRPCFTGQNAPKQLVWCIQVNTGAIVTRRNGKVAIVGNCQMIGRGTRPLPGIVDGIPYADGRVAAIKASRKPSVMVIDLNGNAGRHKLIHAADVLGGNETEDVIARANKKLEKAGGGDVQEAIDAVKREIEDERERERRKHVVAKTTFSVEDVDPLNVLNLPPVPLRGWDTSNPPSEKQLALLDRFGVPRSRVQSKRQASAIIDSLLRRQQEGQVDYRTAARLKAQGAPSNITVGQHLNRMFAGSRA